jgi:prophage maintenance system killer protein
MKTISLAVLVSFLVLSGLALAAQSGEQRDHSSMMQEMMKGEKQGEHMDGMMRMMKMMDQCAAMMESTHGSEAAKENHKK